MRCLKQKFNGLRCTAFLLMMFTVLFNHQVAQAEGDIEEKKGVSDPIAEIPTKGIQLAKGTKAPLNNPVVVKDAKELAKVVPDAKQQKTILGQVDFKKQKLVIFAWAGSGRDKLEVRVVDGDVLKVEFVIQRGRTQGNRIRQVVNFRR